MVEIWLWRFYGKYDYSIHVIHALRPFTIDITVYCHWTAGKDGVYATISFRSISVPSQYLFQYLNDNYGISIAHVLEELHSCKSHTYDVMISFQLEYVPPMSYMICKIQGNYGQHISRSPFYQHELTLIPIWISSHISNGVLDDITYPFLNKV